MFRIVPLLHSAMPAVSFLGSRSVHSVASLAPSRRVITATAFLDSEAAAVPRKTKAKKAATTPSDAIKRAPSAMNLFFRAAAEERKLTLKDAAAAWKELGAGERASFEAESSLLKAAVAEKRWAQCHVWAMRWQLTTDSNPSRAAAKATKQQNAKPLRPYMVFFKRSFAQFKANNPTSSTPEIAKLIAAAWKEVSVEEKAQMLETFKAEVRRVVFFYC